MINIMEVILITFTIGAIFGAIVALHLIKRQPGVKKNGGK